MKLLLDSCTLLWAALDSDQLSTRARQLLISDEHQLFLSVATLWELVIKVRLGKLTLHDPIKVFFN